MSKTALVVDDSTSMRQMVTFTLQTAGFTTIEGSNGAEALKNSESAKVDLVVTDLNMPEMDGITLIKELRTVPISSSRRFSCSQRNRKKPRSRRANRLERPAGWSSPSTPIN